MLVLKKFQMLKIFGQEQGMYTKFIKLLVGVFLRSFIQTPLKKDSHPVIPPTPL